MTRTQANAIISLLVILIIALVVGIAVIFTRSGGEVPTESSPESSTIASSIEVEPAEVLATAELDAVFPAPAPDAVDMWGDYELSESWKGITRVFEDNEPTALLGPNGERFPSTQNACGVVTYLVTFRALNSEALLDAQLRDANGRVIAQEIVSSGWTLGTNCSTPFLGLADLPGEGTLSDVSYEVHEYLATSISQPNPSNTVAEHPITQPMSQIAPSPQSAPAPVFSYCHIDGLVGFGVYSDGSRVAGDSRCDDHPDLELGREAEGVCGGFYGWLEVSAERYYDLCGIWPPTNIPEPSPLDSGLVPDEY